MASGRTIDEQRKENSERNAERESATDRKDQGIRKDERGQEQPDDNKRARENR
jgi:hypothetical protein